MIDGYRKRCNGKWSTYPRHDYYHYHNVIEHAIQAEDDETIQEIMEDFKWMNVKLQQDNTIYHLCTDIRKAIDYLRNKDIKVYLILYDQHLKLDISYYSSVRTSRSQKISSYITSYD